MHRTLSISDFRGGLSDDEKSGAEHGFSFGKALDFRSSPTRVTVHRKLAKESGSTITSEVTDAVRTDGGDIYLAGITEIYKRTPGANGAAGSYAVNTTDPAIVNVRDLDYRPDLDALYAYDESSIHEYSPLSNSPSWDYDKYDYFETVSANQTSLTNNYAIPLNTISETAANKFTWVANEEPAYSATFVVHTKGTGDWTAHLHDASNREVATSTVTNANLPTAGNAVEFVFSDPGRLRLGTEYHIHLTATANDGDVYVATSSDLATANIIIKTYLLVPNGEYGHATHQANNRTYICNERYLAEWEILSNAAGDTAGFLPHRLVFPSECIALGIAPYNEYLAISCGLKRGADSTNDNLTEGVIFFWNQTSLFPDFILPVPQGAPFGLFSVSNVVYWEAKGRWYRWAGGDIEMVYEFPGVDEFTASAGAPQTEIYLRAARHSMAVKDNLLYLGYPYQTANTSLKIGTYSYGNSKGYMPRAIGYDHILSTGTETTQFNTATNPDTPVTGISLVKNFGNNLLVAWKDIVGGSVTYGVDYTNDTSAASTSARFLSYWFDNGRLDKDKTAFSVQVDCEALPAGCTVTPIIEFDRSGSVVSGSGDEIAIEGESEARMTLHDRFREARFGFDITSSSGNFPRIIAVHFKFDDRREESADT